MYYIRWEDELREWTRSFPDRLSGRLYEKLETELMPMIYNTALMAMPIFEGDMRDDFHYEVERTSVGGIGRLKFTGATVMDPEESLDMTTAPFHYPWGIHDGIEPHHVMLFNPRTGRPRSKLIRWAQMKGIISDAVPDDGTPEEIREALEEGDPIALFVGHDPVPFLTNAFRKVMESEDSMETALGGTWSE